MTEIQHPLFLIIDGMSQAYRAYFAIKGLSTSQGLPTNAVYGFAIMLKRVLQKYPPEYIAVALDSSAPTLRHTQYEHYKATRKKMPADLKEGRPKSVHKERDDRRQAELSDQVEPRIATLRLVNS